jgi:hypothetical protein
MPTMAEPDVDIWDDKSLLAYILEHRACPLCGVPFAQERGGHNCDHEAGWYRRFIHFLLSNEASSSGGE